MRTPIPGVKGPIAFLLLILSIAVVTVVIDRGRYWWQWWRSHRSPRQSWERVLCSIR